MYKNVLFCVIPRLEGKQVFITDVIVMLMNRARRTQVKIISLTEAATGWRAAGKSPVQLRKQIKSIIGLKMLLR